MIEILLVEDNAADARLAIENFKDCKVKNNLYHVQDGDLAMDFLKKRGQYASAPKPDLVLLDLNMPRKDGREVLLEIKADPELRDIPVVILTSSRAEEDVVKTYKLNANSYVQKPLDLMAFANIIQAIENYWLSIVILPNDAGR
jgi:CheY-like chemotaxis protein